MTAIAGSYGLSAEPVLIGDNRDKGFAVLPSDYAPSSPILSVDSGVTIY